MILISDIDKNELQQLLHRFSIAVRYIPDNDEIIGSYWGAPEAGIVKNNLYVRDDTPVHSALHESCHYICMSDERRQKLHTDTGGDYDEENAVCYLQIILANHLTGVSVHLLCRDMDDWGYTFRLGSADKWFKKDAQAPLEWLIEQGILTQQHNPTWKLNH